MYHLWMLWNFLSSLSQQKWSWQFHREGNRTNIYRRLPFVLFFSLCTFQSTSRMLRRISKFYSVLLSASPSLFSPSCFHHSILWNFLFSCNFCRRIVLCTHAYMFRYLSVVLETTIRSVTSPWLCLSVFSFKILGTCAGMSLSA